MLLKQLNKNLKINIKEFYFVNFNNGIDRKHMVLRYYKMANFNK